MKTFDVRMQARMRELCAEIGPGDGTDPKQDKKESRSGHGPGRKTLQLCRQVERAVHLVFAEAGDPLLDNLVVREVVAGEVRGRLVVRVSQLSESPYPSALVVARLASLSGTIRAEVARAIHRKRTPDIAFEEVS